MPMNLGGHPKSCRTTTGSAGPANTGTAGVRELTLTGRKTDRGASSLGAKEGHRSSTARCEWIYYSQSFSEVP